MVSQAIQSTAGSSLRSYLGEQLEPDGFLVAMQSCSSTHIVMVDPALTKVSPASTCGSVLGILRSLSTGLWFLGSVLVLGGRMA